jgi:hypothetical protein
MRGNLSAVLCACSLPWSRRHRCLSLSQPERLCLHAGGGPVALSWLRTQCGVSFYLEVDALSAPGRDGRRSHGTEFPGSPGARASERAWRRCEGPCISSSLLSSVMKGPLIPPLPLHAGHHAHPKALCGLPNQRPRGGGGAQTNRPFGGLAANGGGSAGGRRRRAACSSRGTSEGRDQAEEEAGGAHRPGEKRPAIGAERIFRASKGAAGRNSAGPAAGRCRDDRLQSGGAKKTERQPLCPAPGADLAV